MKAGVAKAVITPPVGVELWGYSRRENEFTATGVLDNLWVRVLVLDPSSKDTSIALINLDLGGIDGQWAKEVKQIIEKETFIPSKNIIFSVTHTHAGPAPFWSRGLGEPNFKYLRTLKNTIVKTVKEALAEEVQVQGGVGVGRVNLSVNRRERLFDGLINQNSGNVDSQVRVYRLDKQTGDPLALLVNYSAHATTLDRDNRKFSADYPGIMIRILEKNLKAQAFFLQGAAGNIEPKLKGNYQSTKQMGKLLAKEVLRINADIQTQSFSQFIICQQSLTIHRQNPPSIEWIMQELKKNKKNSEESLDEFPWFDPTGEWRKIKINWLESLLRQLKSNKELSHIAVPLHVLIFNGTYWVTLVGEPFVELGQIIQDRFPDKTIFIIGYANDTTMGYIPTKQAYIKKGYEVNAACCYYGEPGLPVVQGTGEELVEELTKMIKSSR